MSAIAVGGSVPALAQACTREGPVVSCDDGRRGLLSGDAIIWPDGTRSSLSPHPSVIIGNKSSVRVTRRIRRSGQRRRAVARPDRARTRRAAPLSMACRIATSVMGSR
jgi:hypothetical protein